MLLPIIPGMYRNKKPLVSCVKDVPSELRNWFV